MYTIPINKTAPTRGVGWRIQARVYRDWVGEEVDCDECIICRISPNICIISVFMKEGLGIGGKKLLHVGQIVSALV